MIRFSQSQPDPQFSLQRQTQKRKPIVRLLSARRKPNKPQRSKSTTPSIFSSTPNAKKESPSSAHCPPAESQINLKDQSQPQLQFSLQRQTRKKKAHCPPIVRPSKAKPERREKSPSSTKPERRENPHRPPSKNKIL